LMLCRNIFEQFAKVPCCPSIPLYRKYLVIKKDVHGNGLIWLLYGFGKY
jgi:hypothetical protein